MTALSVLSRYPFKQLRPGENDKTFSPTGPGIVVIACEHKSKNPGEVLFNMLTAVGAENDALEVATRLLKQGGWQCDGYVFALLAPVRTKSERLSAIAKLSPMCSAGT